MTTRWGIAAPGGIAAQFVDGLALVDGAVVAAVGSRSKERADAFGDRFDIPNRHGSYDDLVADPTVDVVYVATPHAQHEAVVLSALEAGKHVLCEKPPGRTVQDIERIMSAERRNAGRVLKFGFNHRYHFGVMEARKIVEGGKYGRVLWMRGIYGKAENRSYPAAWRQDPALVGGGILLDQGIHMLDLFRHFGGEFSEIKSMCTTPSAESPLEDNAFALLRNDECIAMLHSSSTQWKHRFTLEIFMEEGYVIVDGMPSTTRSYRDEWLIESRKGKGFAVGNPPEQATFCNTDPSWELELAEFVDCIRTGRPVRNGTSQDAYETMRLVFGIYDADEEFARRRAGVVAGAAERGDA